MAQATSPVKVEIDAGLPADMRLETDNMPAKVPLPERLCGAVPLEKKMDRAPLFSEYAWGACVPVCASASLEARLQELHLSRKRAVEGMLTESAAGPAVKARLVEAVLEDRVSQHMRAQIRDYFVCAAMIETGLWPRTSQEAKAWLHQVGLAACFGEDVLLMSVQRVVDYICWEHALYYSLKVPYWGGFSFLSSARLQQALEQRRRPDKRVRGRKI